MSAIWPSGVATDANLYVAVNGLETTLASTINNSVTTIGLASSTGFPTAGAVVIDSEVIFYTGISGANLTGCTRGADGTSAASHNAGVPVSAAIVAAHHNLLKDEIEAIETYLNTYVLGVTSSIQTQLNGKLSLTGGTITGDVSIQNASTQGPRLDFDSTDTGGHHYIIVSGGSANGAFPTGALTFRDSTIGANRLQIDGSTGLSTFSGNLSISKAIPRLELSGTTTTAAYLYCHNATGATIVGQEQSTGGWLVSGSAPYATIVANDGAYPIQLATNGTVKVTIDSVGIITQPSQPSFLVTDGTGATDVTGDGTAYTKLWPTEVYDQGNNFASNTFTAPVTGRYLLTTQITLQNLATSHNQYRLAINTSNRNYRRYEEITSPPAYPYKGITLTVVADMDAGDTATVELLVGGGAKTVDVYGDAPFNSFSGSLIN